MKALLDLIASHNEDAPMDVAALELASIEFPGLDVEMWLSLLDSYANELGDRVSDRDDGAAYIQTANEYLFKELGFRGNNGDYYSPMNSCLNQVLMERTGLPITLSLVYMEISRRLNRPVVGIGMPGHFLAAYEEDDQRFYIDPFHEGRILEAEECLALASRVTGIDMSANFKTLEPVGKRQMALRMLNNLRAAYLHQGAWSKALQVQELLVTASPNEAVQYRQRGYLHLQMKHFREALDDLEEYLEGDPEARDRAEVERRLQNLRRWVSGLN